MKRKWVGRVLQGRLNGF